MTDVELNWTPSEVETLRSELERTESALASAMAENEALKEDLTAANKRIANQIEQIGLNADQIHRLQRELAQARNERDVAAARPSIAELNAWAPVVEAARYWRDSYGGDGRPMNETGAELAAAVDAMDWRPGPSAEERLVRLRATVRHLLDLYDSGNVLGTIAAIPGLREALDGET